MSRNKVLLRKILCDAEHRASAEEPITIQIDDYAPGVVSEHIHLAVEAGFLEAERAAPSGQWLVKRLTWDGHEELDRMRNADKPFRLERS